MLLFFAVSFLASIIGAICGIGGGVIIKPVLDSLHMESAAAVNFLSGCTVLSMSLYAVGRTAVARTHQVEAKTGVPLSVGAALGGLGGHILFDLIRGMFANQNRVSAVQAACLALITLGTLLYELNKERIKTRQTEGFGRCAVIGLCLGVMSSFLGIGGGPINLVVLFYFFSMDTKTAAVNSLYIILCSQLVSIASALVMGSVPAIDRGFLPVMILGGISGGILGRAVNRRIQAKTVDKLVTGLMAAIICVSLWNLWHYAAL